MGWAPVTPAIVCAASSSSVAPRAIGVAVSSASAAAPRQPFPGGSRLEAAMELVRDQFGKW